MKTVAFFNNKGGVGKTTLVFHLAWALRELDHRVVVADFDPQANLTTFFLDEERIESLLEATGEAATIYQALTPILEGEGGLRDVQLLEPVSGITLIPGDLRLSEAESEFSDRWNECLNSELSTRRRAFRTESAFYRAIESAGRRSQSDIALIDVGPNLGPLNRAVLVASDYVVVPLGSDAFSLQGLRNVGGRLKAWREDWKRKFREAPADLDFAVPRGGMQPIGYVLSRFSLRDGRPAKAYRNWTEKMPEAYRSAVLAQPSGGAQDPRSDINCLAELRDYRSLMPMAHDANKPVFALKPADGAIGAHQAGVAQARNDFQNLAKTILSRI